MQTKKITRIFTAILALLACVSLFTGCANDKKAKKYSAAYEKIEQGDYAAAYALFSELGTYKNSENELAKFYYMPTAINSTSVYSVGEEPETESVVVTFNDTCSFCNSDIIFIFVIICYVSKVVSCCCCDT